MGSELSPEQIQQMKDEVYKDMKEALDELRRDEPKLVNTVAMAVSGRLGGSAVITSRLAAEGVVVLLVAAAAPPVAILYVLVKKLLAKKRENAKREMAMKRAIEKFYKIQERFIANAEYLREELAEAKAYIDSLERELALLDGGR